MTKATFRFYEELNDFLTKPRRKVDFEVAFRGKRSVKDMIESLGVPHTEVDLILINGNSVDFNYIVKDGDRASVYPTFESFNIKSVTYLRRKPLRQTRFIADINLGDIVKRMRMIGFDVYFNSALINSQIIDVSLKDKRIILTKSKQLLKFKKVTHAIFIHPGSKDEQVKRIINKLDIKNQAKPFSRCLHCNSLLKKTTKEDVLRRIPPKTRDYCEEYFICESCDKLFWNGTHMINMGNFVYRMLH